MNTQIKMKFSKKGAYNVVQALEVNEIPPKIKKKYAGNEDGKQGERGKEKMRKIWQ